MELFVLKARYDVHVRSIAHGTLFRLIQRSGVGEPLDLVAVYNERLARRRCRASKLLLEELLQLRRRPAVRRDDVYPMGSARQRLHIYLYGWAMILDLKTRDSAHLELMRSGGHEWAYPLNGIAQDRRRTELRKLTRSFILFSAALVIRSRS